MSAISVLILKRQVPDQSEPQYTAYLYEGDPRSITPSEYAEMVIVADTSWFSGPGAYARARMLGFLHIEDERSNGNRVLPFVVELCSEMEGVLPENGDWFIKYERV